MIITLLLTITIVGGFIGINTIVTLVVYGSPINDKKISDKIYSALSNYHLASVNSSILSDKNIDLPHISKTDTLFFPYEIDDIGLVYKFSKLGKAISRRYKEERKKRKEEALEKIYKRLKIQ